MAEDEGGSTTETTTETVQQEAPASADVQVPAPEAGGDETVPQQQADEQVPAGDMPQELLDKAVDYGLTAEQIEAMGKEGVEKEIDRLEKIVLSRIAKFPGAAPQAAQPEQKPPALPQEKQQEQKAPPPPAKTFEGLPVARGQDGRLQFTTDWSQFDEASGKELQARDQVLAALDQAVQSLSRKLQERQDSETLTRIDSMIGSLDPEIRKDFGDGPTAKLKQGPAFELRQKLLQHMDAVDEGFAKQGIRLSEEEVFAKAKDLLLSERIKEIERKKIADRLQKRKGGMMSRPASREGDRTPPKSSKEYTADDWEKDPKVQAIFSKFGVTDEVESFAPAMAGRK